MTSEKDDAALLAELREVAARVDPPPDSVKEKADDAGPKGGDR